MTPSIKSSPAIESLSILCRISTMEYAAMLIIGISLLLRLVFIGHSNLLVEEAYYWNYAQHLDFGYLDHPPMVAVLIKLTTSIFGTDEFSVRFASLLCWLLTAFFSFKLTNLLARGAGLYAVMLLAILPFFFLHSLVITPDQPLNACWSATLYCLYRALLLNESKYWYGAGLWLGLGLLSKYTIVLLGPATLLYLCLTPTARSWFARKEPYIGALIAALLFTPVIYWNATHEWVSFLFQSTRRLESTFSFSLHQLIGLLVLFLMPPGILGLWQLLKKNASNTVSIETKTKRFLQVFTLVPLIFFGVFSLSHGIKFNWIGPGLLAIIPWLAMLIKQIKDTRKVTLVVSWLITAALLLIFYSGMMFVIIFGTPDIVYKKLFLKYIAWDDLTQQVHTVASHIEIEKNTHPIIVPLDLYNIGSELSFYQAKFMAHGDTHISYPIIGRQLFGADSLMYRYWSPNTSLANKTLIIISNDLNDFNNARLKQQVIEKSPLQTLWSHSPMRGAKINPYYYQVVQMKP
jgi:hypothetical protein